MTRRFSAVDRFEMSSTIISGFGSGVSSESIAMVMAEEDDDDEDDDWGEAGVWTNGVGAASGEGCPWVDEVASERD